ncbi:MAG: hypothetical protein CBD93_000205 [Pelagibacteraceae bacterium TMED233]|jgi:hypothetical protein|nr:MAG: hypothetical protein CBD93_000205 [Pelagibacteraceae bacterium TMED233]|tara:strand:- start:181 stop:1161 length:981 start_codon:yes stop_codon:yes gene_type:complete
MASTYTQNAGIEKPGTGDQSGTWGVTTNTNFDIIDRAVHGQVTISSIAGNTVLTTSDGALSNGIAPVIILTGSPGATFELRVTPTDQKKHYTIKNETDGACRVIYQGVTYSTSNGVEIAPNSTQAVTGDGGGGSGVFKSLTPSTDLINDLTPQLGGDLDVVTHDIVSTSNRNIDLVPHGTGDVTLQADTVQVGDSNADATITSNGTANLILSTNGGTNSGTITIEDGVNNDISVTPNGTGSVILDGLKYPQADGSSNQVLKTDGSGNLAFADASSSLGSSLTLGGWTISVDSNNDLNFAYGGTIRVSIATNGAMTSGNDITAFGSP